MGIFGRVVTAAILYYSVKRVATHINETRELCKAAKGQK